MAITFLRSTEKVTTSSHLSNNKKACWYFYLYNISIIEIVLDPRLSTVNEGIELLHMER